MTAAQIAEQSCVDLGLARESYRDRNNQRAREVYTFPRPAHLSVRRSGYDISLERAKRGAR